MIVNTTTNIDVKNIDIVCWDFEKHSLFDFLKHTKYLFCSIEEFYPDFRHWFEDKVILDILSTRASRKILIPKYSSEIIIPGISIIKNGLHDEEKICTFMLDPRYRRMSIGTKLMYNTLRCFCTDKPVITVCEERHSELETLLNIFDFTPCGFISDIYKKGSKEYFYNISK